MQKVRKIVLAEHDGIFFDGVPKNVVLMVTFNNGSEIRVPYAADKPISALYEDLNAIAPEEGSPKETMDQEIEASPKTPLKPAIFDKAIIENASLKDRSHIIEKEDMVKLIMLDPGRSPDATCLLEVGQELRVLTVRKSNGHVTSYEVVDDNCNRPERTTVFPNEVQLLRKRTAPIIPLETKIEEVLPCPHCNVPTPLALEGSEFKGVCMDCQQEITIARIIKRCLTESCANKNHEVSCLDVGGKYEGKCNKCGVAVEVPYA